MSEQFRGACVGILETAGIVLMGVSALTLVILAVKAAVWAVRL
jgi:hypothetical protein